MVQRNDATDLLWLGDTCRLQPEEEEIEAAMVALDADGDGSVTTEEFEAWWLLKGGWEYASQPAQWVASFDGDPAPDDV